MAKIKNTCRYDYEPSYMHMLRAKHGFAQSRDCPVQTLDPWFVVQTMDWPPNPGIACAHSRIAGAQIKAGIDL